MCIFIEYVLFLHAVYVLIHSKEPAGKGCLFGNQSVLFTLLIGVFDLKQRCADRSVYDKVTI